MVLIKNLVSTNRDLKLLIESPIITGDKKLKVLQAILQGKVNELTLKFINILIAKGREAYLDDTADAFIAQYNQLNHITPVKLITATPASEALRNEVRTLLQKQAGLEKIELTTAVDPSLIGGFIIRYADRLYDASVKSKLQKLKTEFSKNTFVKA
jgi:F-type H+-transporting ATPase subunit delta